jgi:hypothetical protein
MALSLATRGKSGIGTCRPLQFTEPYADLSPRFVLGIVRNCRNDSSSQWRANKEWTVVELGSVADWVAAVGTVGALLATIFIVFDNERRARRSQADGISVWSTQRVSSSAPGRSLRFLDVYIYNGSSHPLPTATVYSRVPGRDYIEEILSSSAAKIEPIQPGASLLKEIPVLHYVDVDRVFVFFTSRDGQRWARRLSDSRLSTGVRARRLAEGERGLRTPR